MHELHENEQYFFDQPTIAHLANFVVDSGFSQPCCICAPMLGQELEKRGVAVTTLDIDDRFAPLKGFQHYDIYRPQWLDRQFDLIICDPPFFNLSLSQLFQGLRMLAHNDYRQKLLVSYLSRRGSNILGTFTNFNLAPTGYFPTYRTVQKVARNEIEFFGNLGADLHEKLCTQVG